MNLLRGQSGRTQSDCPVCSMPLNAHTNTVGREPPRAGEWTVCLYCKHLLRFTLFGLRQIRGRELDKALRDPNVRRALAIVEQIHDEGRVRE